MHKAVIGDIHGCVRTLDALINQLEQRWSPTEYIFLGDVVDRGRWVKESIRTILELSKSRTVTTLCGNHEDMMLDWMFRQGRYQPSVWMTNGGQESANSFTNDRFRLDIALGADVRTEVVKGFEPFNEWATTLKMYAEIACGERKFLCVHAGVGDPHAPLGMKIPPFAPPSEKNPFLWNRQQAFATEPYFDYIVLHGHTPVKSLHLDADPSRPYMNISPDGRMVSIAVDTGCVYGISLSAVVIHETGEYAFETVSCKD